jgi:choline transporter-like protein 2/4/5
MGFREQDLKDAEENQLDGFNKDCPFEMQDRSCTDPICCLIYVLMVLACIGITGYGFATGSPSKLMASYDNNGRMCGDSKISVPPENSFADYKYKFFVNLSPSSLISTAQNGEWAIGVCAKSCPKKGAKLVAATDYVALTKNATSKLNVNRELTVPFDTQ